jgi:hypothetical protein
VTCIGLPGRSIPEDSILHPEAVQNMHLICFLNAICFKVLNTQGILAVDTFKGNHRYSSEAFQAFRHMLEGKQKIVEYVS